MNNKLPFFSKTSLICTWFGAGRLRPMPGTWGSFFALPFAYIVAIFTGIAGLFLFTVLITLIGIKESGNYMEKTGTHDPGSIVIDEVAGIFMSFFLLGVIFCFHSIIKQENADNFILLLVSDFLVGNFNIMDKFDIRADIFLLFTIFCSFRVFDIIKPWPVCWADKSVKGGLGVMLDDVIAGVFTAFFVYLMLFLAIKEKYLYFYIAS